MLLRFLKYFSDVFSTHAPAVPCTITRTLELMTYRTIFLKKVAIFRAKLSSKISAKDNNSLPAN